MDKRDLRNSKVDKAENLLKDIIAKSETMEELIKSLDKEVDRLKMNMEAFDYDESS